MDLRLFSAKYIDVVARQSTKKILFVSMRVFQGI